jgi:hypothetical protein
LRPQLLSVGAPGIHGIFDVIVHIINFSQHPSA